MHGAPPEIGMRLHDLLKAIRQLKQHRSAAQPAIPTGLLGILAEIDRMPSGCRSRDLAAQAGLDPSTVSRAVAALVTQGLLAREADPHDGRATALVVTAAGRAALSDALRWYGQIVNQALDGWSQDEITALQHGIDRLVADIHTALTLHETTEAAP
ncbi:MarR family winged helix-turn-helix transcriptional regulator [Actinoplanes sp. HUAS TT8]|uniref:MarR family winged helix-turn-helix transcriptional regulator n=1 Tax=Actinoplanes sp. HUAS TT8 TaxID=3447453 RepID=UPI003F51E9EE